MWLLAAIACTKPDDTDAGDTGLPEIFTVECTLDPSPAQAGAETQVTLAVRDAAGDPVPDLVATHERFVHTFILSADLATFGHVHQEDFEEVTGTDLKNSTFHFPYVFPAAGDYLLAFDFARENEYLRSADFETIEGAPAMADAPTFREGTGSDADDLHAELVLDTAVSAGTEAAFHLLLSRGDAPVDDVVPWLGTDAHLAVASFDLQSVGHSHAWFEGIDQMPPGHTMPHLYSGPDIPFRFVFPRAGQYRLWAQLATASHPDPYLFSFDLDVP